VTWLISGVYAVGFLLTVMPAAKLNLAMEERLSGPVGLENSDRYWALFIGVLCGLVWPATVVALLGRRWLLRTLRTDRERRQAKDAELAKLRRLAREHGLPVDWLTIDTTSIGDSHREQR
jgi:hypothetical protein